MASDDYRRYELVECGRPLRLARAPDRPPQGAEVQLRVLAAGVCHTDLHLADGYFDLGDGARIELADRGIRLPHVLGHENAGEVIAVGPDARGVSPGDRVLVYPWIGCDDCARCGAGRGHLCDAPRFVGVFRPGGFAERLVVPHADCLIPLDGLAPASAAPLACSGITVYSALRKASEAIAAGPIVVIGGGGLGLMCMSLLRRLGPHGAYVVEPDPRKREAARAMGALDAFDVDEGGRAELARRIGSGVGAVLDFVGTPGTVAHGLGALHKGGRLVIVGMFGGQAALPIPSLVLRSTSIVASYVGSRAEMDELMALVREHGLPPLPVAQRPMAEVDDAMAALRAGAVVGRTVLVP
jgi:propanol-preferring alcohol dehydrogenase